MNPLAAETTEATISPATHTPKELARLAVEANKAHQYALTKYTEQLEEELLQVDKLLSAAETPDQDDEPDLDIGGTVYLAGAKKAVGPLLPGDFLSPSSLFFDDASKRTKYMNYVTIHPMKLNELEALEEGVKTENQRLQAIDSQRRGQGALHESVPNTIDMSKNTEGLDWNRIAERVSKVVNIPRTADECRIRWLGDKHPDLNHEPWTPTELEKLTTLISDKLEGEIDWVDVAEKLGTHRVPIDCMRRAIRRPHHTWDVDSDQRLLDAVNMFGTYNWNIVARYVAEDATAGQCQGRYSRSLDPTVKRGHWSEEEDARLRLAVTAYGNSWMDVASAIPGRTNDQCRDRWSDRLNPATVKGKWTDEENQSLVEAVKDLGNKWKAISERLGNSRTDSNCRLHYEKLRKQNPQLPIASAGPSKSGSISTEVQASGQIVDEAPNSATSSRPRPQPRARKSKPPAMPKVDNNQPSPRPRPKPKPRTKSKDKEQEVALQIGSTAANETGLGSGGDPGVSASAAAAAGGGNGNEMDVDPPAKDSNIYAVPAKGRNKRPAAVGETEGAPAKKRKTKKSQSNDDTANGNTEAPGNGGDAEKTSLRVGSSVTASTRKLGRPRKTARTEPHEEGEGNIDPARATRTSPRKTQTTTSSIEEPLPAVSVNPKETNKGKAKAKEPTDNVEEPSATALSAPAPMPKPRGRPRKAKPTPAKDKEQRPMDESQASAAAAEAAPSPTKTKGRPKKPEAAIEPVVRVARRRSVRFASKNPLDEPRNGVDVLEDSSVRGVVLTEGEEKADISLGVEGSEGGKDMDMLVASAEAAEGEVSTALSVMASARAEEEEESE